MKKIITLLLTIFLCISCIMIQGCDSSKTNNNGGGGIFEKSLSVSELSIEDFEWETVPSKYNGSDCYTFSLLNKSDYDIIGVEFAYKVREDATDSELKVYDEFMKDHDEYIKETDSPRDVTLKGNKNVLVSKGEKLTGVRFTVGFKDWSWYSYPTDEQFKLMEPKELEIGIVGEDNILYLAYYDFENKIWKLDENTKTVDTWSEKEIAQKISKPDEAHHILITDDEYIFTVYSYGVTADEYSQYVENIKSSGFEEERSTNLLYFVGQNKDGYTINLWYYDEEERLSISVEKEIAI